MPLATVRFTQNLRRHMDVASVEVAAGSLRNVLEAVFDCNEQLRGYLLDDQGSLRQHVSVFVDSQRVQDRRELTDLVAAESEVYVMQALSGG